MAREPLGRNENGYVIHPDRQSGTQLREIPMILFRAFLRTAIICWLSAVVMSFLGIAFFAEPPLRYLPILAGVALWYTYRPESETDTQETSTTSEEDGSTKKYDTESDTEEPLTEGVETSLHPGECSACQLEYDTVATLWDGPGTWVHSWMCPGCGDLLETTHVDCTTEHVTAVNEVTEQFVAGHITHAEFEQSVDKALSRKEKATE